MKAVLNVFTGELLLIPIVTGAPAITTSIETEGADHLLTEAGDYLIPET